MFQPGINAYAVAVGSAPNTGSAPIHYDTRIPASTDILYKLGTLWLNTVSGNIYCLGALSTTSGVTSASWAFLGSTTGDLNSLTTDDAVVVTPTSGTIQVAGNSAQGVSTTGSNAPGKVTVTVATATTGQIGVTTLATNAQAIAGVDATHAVTPAALQAKIGTQTAHGVITGNTGASSALGVTAAGTNGQVLLGSTGADPAFGTFTTTTGVNFTTGAASLAIDVKTDGMAVVDQNLASANLAAQTMYITDNGATKVVYTLPATVAQGTTIKIVGLSAGGWQIAQNAGQTINLGSQVTTSGTGGSVSSTNKFDCVELVATDATTNVWVITSATGSLTFV